MKYMIIVISESQFRDILKESLSDIAYHFTYIDNAIKMLKNDEIILSSALGGSSDLDINMGKYNYLSTTRSKSSGYKRGSVKIVLDGRKLNQKYKSIPVNYWGAGHRALEQEDRIISDDTHIPNFTKYIIEIHALLDSDKFRKNKFLKLCKEKNIPIYFYENQKDFLNQRNSIDLEYSSEYDYNDNEDLLYFFDYDLASFIAYNNPYGHEKILEYLGDEEMINKFEEVLKKRTYNNYKIGASYSMDTLTMVKNDIHMTRSRPNKNSKFLLNLLIKDMRKHKSNNIEEYFKSKQFVGKKTMDDIRKELLRKVFSEIFSILDDEMGYRLNDWIEIDGVYYNHAYESKEIKNYIMEHIKKIHQYFIDKIRNEEKLNYVYGLNADDIRKNVKPSNIENYFKITDKSDFFDLNKELDDIFFNITRNVASIYRENAEKSMEEYRKQFFNT